MQRSKKSIRPYRKRKGDPFTGMGAVVQRAMQKLGLESRIKTHKTFDIWDEVVGGPVSKVAQPYAIKSKTLFVHVRDSVWMRQLKFLEAMIIEKICGNLGYRVVEKIHFKIAPLAPKIEVNLEEKRALKAKLESLTAPSEEDIESLEDPEVRAVFMRIREKLKG